MSYLVCVAQLSSVVGDVAANTLRILDAARQAHAAGARLMLSPAQVLGGYAPQDLLLRPAFVAACEQALADIAAATADLPGLALVIGHPQRVAGQALLHDAVSVLREGVVVCSCARRTLLAGGVSDDPRYFMAGGGDGVFEHAGLRFAIAIGPDMTSELARRAAAAGAQMLLVADATAYHLGQSRALEQALEQALAAGVQRSSLPLVCARAVGGHDALVFEGRSLALQADGQVAMRLPGFTENMAFAQVDAAEAAITIKASVEPLPVWEEELWQALVCAVRGYVDGNGFAGALLGMSGGMDSALVLAIAVDALGSERVRALMMPSPYTAEISRIDATEMARRMSVRIDEIAIEPLFAAFKSALAPVFAGRVEDTTEENLQARIRGTLLMALSNKTGAVVLSTGNKSELAAGYCTLYGDMVGGFAVIRDVLKTQVFALARWRNANDPFGRGDNPIPERIITRPPSAELRENQTDQDSLPPYDLLDAIITRHVEEGEDLETIVRAGLPREMVQHVLRLIRINEYKRKQAPVGPRVSRRGFGSEWRQPVSHRFMT